jgi:hypothetical protein
VSTGQALKAMILNGLGFVSAPLYLFEQFFYGKATEHLIAPGIRPEHLNEMTDWGGFWTSSLRPTRVVSSSTWRCEPPGTSESAPKASTWMPPLCTSPRALRARQPGGGA